MKFARLISALALAFAGLACHREPSALDHLHPCTIDEGPTEAFCGSYSVFENRTAKSGRQIALKIVILPALKRNPQRDPLFVFQGGPGAGAAKLADYEIPMFHRFEIDRDIVLIDQRGTGDSNSLACEAEDRDKDDDLSDIDAYPLDRFHKCLDKYQADPRLYTTEIAMDDIDEVRHYLGYGQINLWGGSYGTRAALVYLHRHEDSVRSVVLDSVAPPDMRLGLFIARDGQRALDLMIDDCAKGPACSKQYPHLRDSVNTLFSNAARNPHLTITHPRTGKPVPVTITQRLVASIIFSALYNSTFTSVLPQLITDGAQGNYQGLLALAFSSDLPKGAISEGMFLSVVCAEDMPRIHPDDIQREARDGFMGTAFFDTRMKPCEFWPRGSVSDDFYQPIRSSKPVLILSGLDDPITPPSWGDHIAQYLPNSRHFIVPGTGHGATPHGCVPELIGKFLDQASAANLDSSCLQSQHRPPFFVNYSGAEQP